MKKNSILLVIISSIIFIFLVSSCCCLAALSISTIDIIDRVSSNKSEEQLLEDYSSAKNAFLLSECDSWIGEKEKDLVYSWGAPVYYQEFDDGDRILIYESKSITTITTGGDTVSEYCELYDTTYTTKEDEITTVKEKKGEVKVFISNSQVKKINIKGILVELDKIIKPTDKYSTTNDYLTKKEDLAKKESDYDARTWMNSSLPYIWGGALTEILLSIIIAGV